MSPTICEISNCESRKSSEGLVFAMLLLFINSAVITTNYMLIYVSIINLNVITSLILTDLISIYSTKEMNDR